MPRDESGATSMSRSLLPDYFRKPPVGQRLRRDLVEVNARVHVAVVPALLATYAQDVEEIEREYSALWDERGFPKEMQKIFGISILVDEVQSVIAVPLFHVHKNFEAAYLREPYVVRKEALTPAFLGLLARPLPDSEAFELLIALLNGEDIEDLLR